jgi:hypothetical protein
MACNLRNITRFSTPRRLAFPNATSALPVSRVPGPHVVLDVALLVVAVSEIVDGSVEAKENGIESERGKCSGMSKGLLRKRLLQP